MRSQEFTQHMRTTISVLVLCLSSKARCNESNALSLQEGQNDLMNDGYYFERKGKSSAVSAKGAASLLGLGIPDQRFFDEVEPLQSKLKTKFPKNDQKSWLDVKEDNDLYLRATLLSEHTTVNPLDELLSTAEIFETNKQATSANPDTTFLLTTLASLNETSATNSTEVLAETSTQEQTTYILPASQTPQASESTSLPITNASLNASASNTTASTAAAAPLPSPLSFADATVRVATIPGLQSLGPVEVLYEELVLGVPAEDTDTIYTPFNQVRIVVPAGAWLARRRDGGAARPMTVTAFALPAGLALPGVPCGPALDFGPRDQLLGRAIVVSLPCSGEGNAPGRAFRYDPVGRTWAREAEPSASNTTGSLDGDPAAWAETMLLGTHAALQVAPPGAPGISAGAIAGAVMGALVAVALAAAAACLLRSRRGYFRADNAYAPT